MALNKENMVADMYAVCNAWGLSEHTEEGLFAVYDEWFTAKADLRAMMSRHPAWNEDAQAILFKTKYLRTIDLDKYTELMEEFYHRWTECVDSETPSCRMHPYIYDKLFTMFRDNFITDTNTNAVSDNFVDYIRRLGIDVADYHGRHDAQNAPWLIEATQRLGEYVQYGQKRSKVLNKFMELVGAPEKCGKIRNSAGNLVSWYDGWFAQVSDILNPREVELTTALSINPCDFMNMSRGTKWRSCHNMKNGSWRTGCISYLLDSCSTILYTVEEKNDELKLHQRDKINRQLYMWNGFTVLASRLYPDNENKTLKATFADAVKDIVKKCLGIDTVSTSWTSFGYSNYREYIETPESAKQYKDYSYEQYRCTMYVVEGHTPEKLVIGATPISLKFGVKFDTRGNCNDLYGRFVRCSDCGKLMDKDSDDYLAIGGETYCKDHAFVCGVCGSVHRITDLHDGVTYQGNKVCNSCYESNRVECEFCKEDGFKPDMLRYRMKNGRMMGKYAHKGCIPESHMSCRCGAYQKRNFASTLTTPDGSFDICSACSTVVSRWFNELYMEV